MEEESDKTQETAADDLPDWVLVPIGFVTRVAFYLAMGWIAYMWLYTGAVRRPLASVSLLEIIGDLFSIAAITGLILLFIKGFDAEDLKGNLRIWGGFGFMLAFLARIIHERLRGGTCEG